MTSRAPLVLSLIAVLAIVVAYLNTDLVRAGHEYSPSVTRLLSWQGEEPGQRSLRLRQGLDLQGGLQVLMQADMRGAQHGDLERAANTIKNRVDALGVTEPFVQTQGADKIVVELPGVRDKDLAVRTIGQTALLEFVYSGSAYLSPETEIRSTWRLSQTVFSDLPEEHQRPFVMDVPVPVAPRAAVTTTEATTATVAAPAVEAEEPAAEAEEAEAAAETEGVEAEDAAPEEAVEAEEAEAAAETEGVEAAAEGFEAATVYPTVLTGEYLVSASVGLDPVTTEIIVNFQLNAAGGRLMQQFTSQHLSDDAAGRLEVMPIVLDGKIISSPAVRGMISNQGQISGRFSRADAEALVAQLNSGSLPVELTVVGQSGIGPTVGRDALAGAVKGGLLGLVIVMTFMVLFYRLPGLVADLALLLYALIVLSLFRVLPVTLTLAGIAGFVLSLGMAVDANILIFERMKEELRAGRRLSAALDIGFQRAWPSIRDSNFSTLITCVILFWFGSQFGASIVKGFAVTLFLGVITSLFTAIVVTRNFLWLTNRTVVRGQADRAASEGGRRLRFLFGF